MAKLVKIFGGILGGLVATGLFIEIVLRLIGYENVVLDYADADLGNVGRPMARGVQSLEGRNFIELNSLGHHDREHPIEKPKGTYRIVLLGDSFSAAHQVPIDAMMASLLPQDLKSCAALDGKTVEVVNFAYDGFDLRHHYVLMRDRVANWSPDLVMIEMQPAYGLTGFLPREATTTAPAVDVIDGEVVVKTDFRNSKVFKVKSSRAFRNLMYISDHVRLLQYLMELQFKLRSPGQKPADSDQGMTKDWQIARDHALRVLAATNDLAVKQNVPLVVAFATRDTAMDPALPARLRADPLAEDLEAHVHAMGLPVLSISRELSAYGDSNRVYLHGFGGAETAIGHWNREGNRLAAKAYAKRLCGLLTDGTLPRGIAEK